MNPWGGSCCPVLFKIFLTNSLSHFQNTIFRWYIKTWKVFSAKLWTTKIFENVLLAQWVVLSSLLPHWIDFGLNLCMCLTSIDTVDVHFCFETSPRSNSQTYTVNSCTHTNVAQTSTQGVIYSLLTFMWHHIEPAHGSRPSLSPVRQFKPNTHDIINTFIFNKLIVLFSEVS